MDNVSYHFSKKMKKVYEENNIIALRNVKYSPDLNPIELVFL